MKVFILAVFVYFSYHNFHMSKQFADEIIFLSSAFIPNWHGIVGMHYLVKNCELFTFLSVFDLMFFAIFGLLNKIETGMMRPMLRLCYHLN